MTRILQVSSFMPPHPGGLELVVENLVDGLRSRGHALRWLASAPPLQPGVEDHLFRVAAWKRLEDLLHVPFPFWGVRGYATLARLCSWAEVVHVHGCLYPSSIAAATAAALRGRPFVVTQHVAEVPYGGLLTGLQRVAYRTLGRVVLSRAVRVTTCSRHVASYFSALGVPHRFRVVQPGFDARFGPASEAERMAYRAKYRLPPEARVVLFVGRLVPKKGIQHLAGVQRVLADEGVTLMIAGDGALATLIRDLPRTLHLPQVPYGDMHELYGLADALLLPSRGEGLPLTVQEALLTGLRVVVSTDAAFTTNLCGAPGVWLSPIEELVVNVRAALDAQLDRDEIARWARERWNRDRFLTEYEAIYSELLEAHGGTANDAAR